MGRPKLKTLEELDAIWREDPGLLYEVVARIMSCEAESCSIESHRKYNATYNRKKSLEKELLKQAV